MTLNLTESDFTNDFFSVDTDGGCNLRFCSVREHVVYGTYDCEVDAIIIEISQNLEDGTTVKKQCVNVIGLSDDFISISSGYTDVAGVPLTMDNLSKCTIEVTDAKIQ